MEKDMLDEVIGEDTLLVQKTLRSGQSIKHAGHVVVSGDLTATITAFYLNPTQLRIANLISRPPDGDRPCPDHPETARITNGNLIIEKYQPAR